MPIISVRWYFFIISSVSEHTRLILRHCFKNNLPASVKVTPCESRLNNSQSILFSNKLICCTTADGDIYNVLEAAEKLPVSATVKKVSISWSYIFIPHLGLSLTLTLHVHNRESAF